MKDAVNQFQMQRIATYYGAFPEKFGIPRQARIVRQLPGKIVFEQEFRSPDALRGLEDFSHIWLVWVFTENLDAKPRATVRPPRMKGNDRRGVFASRSPFRPNPVGMSAVELVSVEDSEDGPILHVRGADLMDGTAILDIKPYIPYADAVPDARDDFAAAAPEAKEVQFLCDFDGLDYRNSQDLSQNGIDFTAFKEDLIAVLGQDPRPAYQDDPERRYGMLFSGYNVTFHVAFNTVWVDEVVKGKNIPPKKVKAEDANTEKPEVNLELGRPQPEQVKVSTESDATGDGSKRNPDETKPYWVYILRCSDDSLYTGIAVDPEQRLRMHNAGKGAKYTRSHGPCTLVYQEKMESKSAALSREAEIKKMSREKKLELISG